MKMKITVEQFKKNLIDTYTYHYKKARELHPGMEPIKSIDEAYEIGLHDGANNALGMVMLLCFGGKETFDIWQKVRDQEEHLDEE